MDGMPLKRVSRFRNYLRCCGIVPDLCISHITTAVLRSDRRISAFSFAWFRRFWFRDDEVLSTGGKADW